MSTLETLALPGLIVPMKPVTYVAKEKLLHGFFWGPIMRSRNPITCPAATLAPTWRSSCARAVHGWRPDLRHHLSPGTRTEVFDRSAFQQPRVKLAAKAGAWLLPVAVKTDYWGSSGILRGFGPIHRDRTIRVEFGDPLLRQRARQDRARALPRVHRVASARMGGSGRMIRRDRLLRTRFRQGHDRADRRHPVFRPIAQDSRDRGRGPRPAGSRARPAIDVPTRPPVGDHDSLASSVSSAVQNRLVSPDSSSITCGRLRSISRSSYAVSRGTNTSTLNAGKRPCVSR